ncbi:MAG: Gfo/Idh/MocA family protein, partial [Planctomycetaceae bacterium]
MVLACAEVGSHMYLEKPFCRTLGEADEMVRACEMRHLKLAVAHISRWSPQLDQVRRLIEGGEIGEVLEIRARGKEDARGGGEDFWVLGTHVLDLMRALGGDPEQCFA